MTGAAADGSVQRSTLELSGILAIDLVGAGEQEMARLRRQLGPLGVRGDGDADLVIEFVDRLPRSATVIALGRDAAYDEHGLIVRRGRRQTDVRVRIPVDRIGQAPLTIVAERGALTIPYLIPIVGLTALARGRVPVHASGFVHDGRGVLVTGWAKGGKTEALLGFAQRGATYVGDEWIFLDAEGRTMIGLPEPMRVWDWQLDQTPNVRERIGWRARGRLSAAAGSTALLRGGARLPVVRGSAVGDAARRLGAIADRQRSVQVPPARAFEGQVATAPVKVDAIVLIESTLAGETSVEAIDPGALAQRVAAMVVHEWLDLAALLLAHRFAFPEREVVSIGAIGATLEDALRRAVASTRTIRVRHSQPVQLEPLADLLASTLAGR
jgi:hypothetical protein